MGAGLALWHLRASMTIGDLVELGDRWLGTPAIADALNTAQRPMSPAAVDEHRHRRELHESAA
jgi:hypothetical protein